MDQNLVLNILPLLKPTVLRYGRGSFYLVTIPVVFLRPCLVRDVFVIQD